MLDELSLQHAIYSEEDTTKKTDLMEKFLRVVNGLDNLVVFVALRGGYLWLIHIVHIMM